MTDKEQMVIDIVNVLAPLVDMTTMSDIKMRLAIVLSPYHVERHGTELATYEGNKNEQILKRFLAAKIAAGLTARTLKYYQTSISSILQKIGKPYDEVTPDDVRLYLAFRVQRDHVSKGTANNERRNLSAFYGWLQKEEILLANPMQKVDIIKYHKGKKKAYALIDLEKIRMACRSAREKALVEIFASTWCRVTEVAQIKLSEMDGDRILIHGKGEKDREVYLNARALLAVQAYLSERSDDNQYLFPRAKYAGNVQAMTKGKSKAKQPLWYTDPVLVAEDGHMDPSSIEGVVRAIGKRAGVPNVHPHRFRRTGATLALRSGMPLLVVSKMLGHRSVETTQIYLDISDDELEQAHKKYVI